MLQISFWTKIITKRKCTNIIENICKKNHELYQAKHFLKVRILNFPLKRNNKNIYIYINDFQQCFEVNLSIIYKHLEKKWLMTKMFKSQSSVLLFSTKYSKICFIQKIYFCVASMFLLCFRHFTYLKKNVSL